MNTSFSSPFFHVLQFTETYKDSSPLVFLAEGSDVVDIVLNNVDIVLRYCHEPTIAPGLDIASVPVAIDSTAVLKRSSRLTRPPI